jgi:arylsulfatase A-like enzyme
VRQDWAEYLDSATELDRKVGTILEALKADRLADDTIIIFFGDNGQSLARGKQFCYEEGFLVPPIIHWPKNFPAPAHFKPGTRDARMIDGIDLAPTMIDIAGAAKPPKMQGRIFLGDRCEPERDYIFGYRDRCDMTVMRIRSVRDQHWRYIRNFTPWVPFLAFNNYKEKQYPVWTLWPKLEAEGKLTPEQEFAVQPTMPEEELYDIESDPWELHNLAKSDKPEVKEALTRLRGVLEKWIGDTDDHGRRFETLAELQDDKGFVAARDWRPQPGTPEAAEAEKLRAAAKDDSASEQPKKKKGKKNQ